MENVELHLGNQDIYLFPILLAIARLGLHNYKLLEIKNESLLNVLGSKTLFSDTFDTLNRIEARFNSKTRPNNNLRIIKEDI